jgi:type VI secretion system secreted protein Hcp
MDKNKMLWTVLGFGIALMAVGVAAYFYNIDGQEEEEEEPVQPKGGVYLMMVDGIDGEVKDMDHKNWMLLDSFEFPTIKVVEGESARLSGERTYEPIRIVKRIDKSSPKLMEACVKGQVMEKLVIEYCHMTDTDGLITIITYEFINVVINGYHHGSGDGEVLPTEEMQSSVLPQFEPFFDVGKGWSPDRPAESLSLNFEEIKVTYTELDSENKSKGNVEYTWKVEEGEA